MPQIPNHPTFIRKYNLSKEEQEFSNLLIQKYPEIKTWVRENQGRKITARQEFVKFLNNMRPKAAKNHSMKLQTFLGKEGLAKYKAALEEEFNDRAFRFCIIAKAFKKYHGDTQGKIPIIPLGGPSGAGKSTSASQLVARFIPKNKDKPEKNHDFAMAFVDGGIPREQNNMQKILKRFAELQGIKLTEFQEPSKKLMSEVKDKIRDLGYAAAGKEFDPTNHPPVGVVEVETFSGDALLGQKKLHKKIIEKWGKLSRPKQVIMSIVGGDDPAQHRVDVRKMANFRSDPSSKDLVDWKNGASCYKWGEHAHAIPRLKEYKPYEAKGYVNGVLGSWKAALGFWNHMLNSSDGSTFQLVTVENPVKPYHADTGADWKKGDPMQVASPRVHAAAMEAMSKDKSKKFADHCQALWSQPQFRLVMHEVNIKNTSFKGLAELLKKQMNYKTSTAVIGTSMMQTLRGEKKILKPVNKWLYYKLKYSWAERNIPYTIKALELEQKLNLRDYHSVVKTKHEIEAIMEAKRKSRGLWKKIFAFRSHLIPELKKIRDELTIKEHELYYRSRNYPLYFAEGLADKVGVNVESFYSRELILQLAILGVHIQNIGKLLPASFLDYAQENLQGICQELEKTRTKFLSQQILNLSKLHFSEHSWFQAFESNLKPSRLVQEILSKKS